jgi:hypothetical protein
MQKRCVSSRGLFDHGWKHIHLGFYTETGGCDCSLKSAPDDGQDVARNMLNSVYMTKQ